MELVQASLLIPLLIIAVTQIIKMFVPAVNGAVTILVALGLGLLVALVDTHIGVADVNVAQGLVLALGAVGITVLAAKAGGGAVGDGGTTVAR
jgi:peptidoglycan/LPS O-acetylase OafA/YrhL